MNNITNENSTSNFKNSWHVNNKENTLVADL